MRFTTTVVALFVAVAAAKPHGHCTAKDPCKKMQCAYDEECKVWWGKGVCVKKDSDGHDGHDGHDHDHDGHDHGHDNDNDHDGQWDPCAKVKCQYGECKVVWGKPVCPKSPCEGYDCGYDKVCKVYQNKAVCTDKDGHDDNDHDGHSNPCKDYDCGHDKVCKVYQNKPVCKPKDDGHHGGPEPTGPTCCDGYDCGDDKYCKVENNKPVCKPKDDGHPGGNNPCMWTKCAYGECKVVAGKAVCPKNPCDDIRCLWGQCKVVDGHGQCPGKPGQTKCGDKTCAEGTYCCNSSCGTCVKPGMMCTMQACLPTPPV